MTASLDPALFREDAEPFVRALNAYIAREGHARPPHAHLEDGLHIGKWVLWRRSEYKRGILPADRAAALESLPGWAWRGTAMDNRSERAWAAGISALDAFVEREGHARVPQEHYEEGHALGVWVMHRRTQYRRGVLSASRAAVLSSYPGWVWDGGKDVAWPTWFKAISDFVQREGHARVPHNHLEDGLALGAWVSVQRALHAQERLSPKVAAFLETLPGWVWDARKDTWPAYIDALRSFVQREGHTRVPARHVEAGLRLGTWVANGRSRARAGLLSAERKAALEAFPGWVWNCRP